MEREIVVTKTFCSKKWMMDLMQPFWHQTILFITQSEAYQNGHALLFPNLHCCRCDPLGDIAVIWTGFLSAKTHVETNVWLLDSFFDFRLFWNSVISFIWGELTHIFCTLTSDIFHKIIFTITQSNPCTTACELKWTGKILCFLSELSDGESYRFWFVYTYTLVGLLLESVHPQQKAHDIGCAKSIRFRTPMLKIWLY